MELAEVLKNTVTNIISDEFKKEIVKDNVSLSNVVREIIRDELKKNNSKFLKRFTGKLDNINKDIKNHDERIRKQEDITDIIQWDNIKVKELQEAVKARCHYHTGAKHNPKYILFYRSFSIHCNNHIKNIFGVNSTLKLKNEDFHSALKAVKNWRPFQKDIDKRLHNLIRRQEKGLLTNVQDRALNLYMDKISQ